MATQQERREETRAALIDAAGALFRERGYLRTRNADVAEKAGVTTGALYFHFADKEHLFLEALREGQRDRRDWYDVPRRVEPGTPLRTVVADSLAELARNSQASSWTPVIVDYLLQAKDRAAARQELTAIYAAWIDEITRFVAALQDGGWVAARHDAATLATHVYSLGAGAQTMGFLYDGGDPATLPDAVAALLAGWASGH